MPYVGISTYCMFRKSNNFAIVLYYPYMSVLLLSLSKEPKCSQLASLAGFYRGYGLPNLKKRLAQLTENLFDNLIKGGIS